VSAQIVKYLATSFPPLVPYNPNNRLPRKPLQGEARNYIAGTYKLTPEYSEPHDIAVDPTGIAWAAKRGASASAGGMLVRFDPHTMDVSEVAPPPGPESIAARRRIGNPQIGPDGVLWTGDA